MQANQQLQDQNTLLKAQLSAGATDPSQTNVGTDNDLLVRLQVAETERTELVTDVERLRKDQEDLLELLTYQEVKLNQFKEKLRQLGEPVDDEDSDVHSIDGSEKESA